MAIDYKALHEKKALNSAEKEQIKADYLLTFGREMRLKDEKCRNCFNDALIELYNHSTPIRTILFNGRWLTTKSK